MKFKYVLISVIVFAFACQNAPKENTLEEKKVTEEIAKVNVQKIELNIDGMTCTGCENAIQKTIDGFEGVYSSKADFEKGKAIFEFDSTKVDIIKVKDAINELGYEAKEHSIITE